MFVCLYICLYIIYASVLFCLISFVYFVCMFYYIGLVPGDVFIFISFVLFYFNLLLFLCINRIILIIFFRLFLYVYYLVYFIIKFNLSFLLFYLYYFIIWLIY